MATSAAAAVQDEPATKFAKDQLKAIIERIERLGVGDEAICFGRIDRDDGEAYHIGRLAVADVDHTPLVIDWRVPAAEPFYRATGRHPMGLWRRRHLVTEGRRVVDLEDELFGETSGPAGDGRLAGPATLLAALERSRTGFMRDIVATVQAEQDQIIRAPLTGVLVVQGGPGTGKTAVALHRAAYLLYSHRDRIASSGVLVVGPSRSFLRYIEAVLPSLGETGVVPVVNQIELHPELQQRALREKHAAMGVVTQSWTPLGQSRTFEHPVIQAAAGRTGATPAQVILAWHLALGCAVIPRSTSEERLAQNLAAVDVTLTPEEVAAIEGLETGHRTGPDPSTFG